MNLALAGAAAQLAGGIFGGRRRDKRAMRQLGEIQRAADDVVQAAREDQWRAEQMRAADEARLKGATGYDLAKLRADAIAGGFNPLTLLQATGGMGYDGRGAILSTPFVGMQDAMRGRVDARLGALGTVTQTAGYFGDALTGFGDSLVGLGRDALQRRHELTLQQVDLAGRTSARSALGAPVSSRPRSVPVELMGADTVTAGPAKVYSGRGTMRPSGAPWGDQSSDLYPGNVNRGNPEGTYPLTGNAVDPFFGESWIVANPDLDNEPLEWLMLMSIPGQALGKVYDRNIAPAWGAKRMEALAREDARRVRAEFGGGPVFTPFRRSGPVASGRTGWDETRDLGQRMWDALPSIPRGGGVSDSRRTPLRIPVPSAFKGGGGMSDVR